MSTTSRPSFSRSDLLTLLGATALMPIANGRWSVALAAWLGPALLIRYLRAQALGPAIAGGLLAMSVAEYFWWKGIVPVSGVTYVAAAIAFGCVNLVPYLLDRAIGGRIRGFAGTLVLPSVMVLHEALTERVSPFGSWGSFAYTQSANLPLLQILSVTGLAGVTFLVLWFAAVINWIAEESFAWDRVRRGTLAYAVVFALAHLLGEARLLRAPEEETVRIAALTPPIATYTVRGDDANSAVHEALASVRAGRILSPAAREAFRQRAASINLELLDRTEQEASSGAKLIVWSEGAGVIDALDEATLIAQGAEIARRTGSFVGLSFLTLDFRGGRRFRNANVLLDAEGRTAWTYDKAHPVPGMEDNLPAGDGLVPFADAPFARLAAVICFDLDFPRLMSQAGRADADLVLVPADDWPEVASTHARMAKFRAIEQGFSVVRPASNGLSTAYDPYGRLLSKADYFKGEFTLVCDVPASGVATAYTRASGVIPGVSAIVLVVLAILAIAAESKRRRLRTATPADR